MREAADPRFPVDERVLRNWARLGLVAVVTLTQANGTTEKVTVTVTAGDDTDDEVDIVCRALSELEA